jgi:hypothetical protein
MRSITQPIGQISTPTQIHTKTHTHLKAIALMGLASLALSGCGGGGGGTPAASTPGQAQGVYNGSFSTSTFPTGKFSTLVLDNDEIWTLYGREGTSGQLLVYGLIQGQGSSSSGSFTSSSLKDYYYDGTSMSETLSATYQVGSTFNGTVSANGQSVSFSGVVPATGSTSYNYNTSASLSDISGSWSASNMGGVTSSFTISTTGTFSGTNQYGCGFSGSVNPRSSGKNVFDVSITNNTSTACGSASGLTGRGIAVSSILTSGSRQLIVAVVSSDRVYGSAIFASR